MSKMKIGYFADGPWSHEAFKKINVDKLIDIKFIVPRFDTNDATLKGFAEGNNIDYLLLKNVNSEDSLQKIQSYDCDLLVSMSFNQIFRKEIINLTKHKIINCHAGKLPFYRGRNILNWVLINDEKEFGITVHYVDEGIDTGDIILQQTYPITDSENYKSLLEIAYLECASLLYESIKLIQNNQVKPINQESIHPIGMYCGRRGIGDENINWNDTSRNVFNFIRSVCYPGPKATSFIGGLEVKINKSEFIPKAPCYIGKPGQILSKTDSGFLVKTKDSFIEIMEIEGKLTVGKVLS